MFRHKVITGIARPILGGYVRLKYGVKIIPFKEQKGKQYLVLFNHQTAYDQFLVGMSFKRPIYYVASEDLFSNGFVSKLLRWAVAPIPIKKQANDSSAVMNCIRVAKEGGTIAIAPEGNRTYSGTTEYIKSSIVKLIKVLKLPVAFLKIEGGYGVHPRWADKIRRGKITTRVSKVIEVEELKTLSDDELFSIIKSELYVNDYDFTGLYKGRKRAEFLERAIYVCPNCGFSYFYSDKNKFKCKNCSLEVYYGEDKILTSSSEDFSFKTVKEWYDYQANFVRKTNFNVYIDKPIYKDKTGFYEVKLYDKKRLIDKDASISIYANKLIVEYKDKKLSFDFDKVSVLSVLGRNKLNVYFEDKLYQFKSDKRFNALKYVQLFYCAKGGVDNEFLGL